MKITNVPVGTKEFDEIASHITKGYPNACIMFIEKVEDHILQSKFDTLKSSMIEPNEKLLFHGTNERNAYAIVQNGYDPACNTRSAYGKGTYFALSPNYSKNYTDISYHKGGFELSFMLINTVLVGKEFVKGGKGDTQVDLLAKPTIFCVPLAHQAIPKYIVAFHKNAGA